MPRGAKEQPLEPRFFSKVEKQHHGCWVWKAAKSEKGYGYFGFKGKVYKAHRVSWFLKHGVFPSLQLDHLCRNTSCVNPDHLEEVSNRENQIRGLRSALNPRKTSRFVGVSWSPTNRKWQVRFGRTYLGHFDREEDAATAYEEAIRQAA